MFYLFVVIIFLLILYVIIACWCGFDLNCGSSSTTDKDSKLRFLEYLGILNKNIGV